MKTVAEGIIAASAVTGEARAFASAIEVLQDGQVKTRFRVLPIGTVTLRDGRGPFTVTDRVHAAQIVAASQAYAGAQDLPVDYDHQTHFAAIQGVGGRAPAAGWIKRLTAEDDGVYVDVEWTGPASAQLKAKEYRYVSPLFGFDSATGLVTRIFNVGLTNTPAIDDLGAIAAQVQPQGKSMDLTQLAALYGLPATATLTEILAAASTAKAAATQTGEDLVAANAALVATRTALGLKDDAKTEDVVAAATARKPDPSAFAPMSIVTDLQQQVASLTSKNVSEIVAAATAAGKVRPDQASQDWARDYANKDLPGFERFVAAATAIVTPGPRTAPNNPGGGDPTTLTAEEKVAASIAGVSEADFLATKKELAQ